MILENQHDESYKVETLEKKCLRLQSIIDRMEVRKIDIICI
jgi:hypothetical protein